MIFFINIIEKLSILVVQEGIPFPPAPLTDDEAPPPPEIPIDGLIFIILILAILLAFYFIKNKNIKLTD